MMTSSVSGRKQRLKWVVAGILAFLLIISSGLMIFIKNFYDANFPRHNEPKYSGYLRFSDVEKVQPTLVKPALVKPALVKFMSGKNTLAGYLFGAETAKGLVVIAPGQGEGAVTFLAASLYFVDQGWRVFSYDPTGTFASGGDNMVGLPQSRFDLHAALNYIKNEPALKDLPLMLYGHSWGGYAVTAILNDRQDISAAVSISGFNAPMGIMAEDAKRELGLLGEVAYPFGWAYQYLRFGQASLVTAVKGINRTDIPVMIIHGSEDESVAYNGASIIAQRAAITNPKVVYKTCSAENRNGHNSLYRSAAAIQYAQQKNQEYQVLLDRYQGYIPDAAKADFYAGVDRYQTSELDASFMRDVSDFFESALSHP